VGSIGTSNTGPFPTNNGRTLSHEAGHWLGLRHIWGDNTCANDFVNDTPEHEDANNGCPVFPYKPFNACGGDANGEMYVNYMDYTDGNCQNMFSAGQSARMNTILTTMRTNIWSNGNLIATGTDGSPAVLCAPKADFAPVQQFVCAGDSVRFIDASYNGQPASRSWLFPGGTPAASSDSMPWVTYSTPGTYSVTLTTSNSAGSNSITKTNIIVVTSNTAQYSSWQYWEGFDTGLPSDWFVLNHQSSTATWAPVTTAYYSGGGSMKITNTASNAGQIDELVSPTMNLTQINLPKIYFYVSYAQRVADDNDALRVYISTDCGQNWIQRMQKTGTTLKTVSPVTGNFTPTLSSQWRLETVSLVAYSSATRARFKFEFTSDGGNNIYIDQVNLGGTLSEEDPLWNPFAMNIFPNPVQTGATVVFTNEGNSHASLEILDLTGKVVKKLYEGNDSGEKMIPFDNTSLSAGIYFVKLDIGGRAVVKKLVVN
jgi:PKD repeat protein